MMKPLTRKLESKPRKSKERRRALVREETRQLVMLQKPRRMLKETSSSLASMSTSLDLRE